MRPMLGCVALCGALVSTGLVCLADEFAPPPSVAHPSVQPAMPYRPVPAPGEPIAPHPEFAMAPSAPEHAGAYGSHQSLGARLRGWLTYRAAPAPRECKCIGSCTGCFPPLYSYFALRYPAAGHGYPSHDAPFVTTPAPFHAAPNP